jgi:hypothetical protein
MKPSHSAVQDVAAAYTKAKVRRQGPRLGPTQEHPIAGRAQRRAAGAFLRRQQYPRPAPANHRDESPDRQSCRATAVQPAPRHRRTRLRQSA